MNREEAFYLMNEHLIKISLNSDEFNELINGRSIKRVDSRTGIEAHIMLQDIGYSFMIDAIENADINNFASARREITLYKIANLQKQLNAQNYIIGVLKTAVCNANSILSEENISKVDEILKKAFCEAEVFSNI